MKARVRVTIWVAWILAAGAALDPRVAFAQPPSANFETWQEPLKARTPEASCDHLRALTGYDFSIDNAVTVPAQGEVPEFCLVQGLIIPEIRFEFALPREWNGRLYMFGNGGFAGESLASPGRLANRNSAISRGFATAQTNTGHDAAREPLATFASNPQKLADYAYRAVHVTAMTAKTVIRAYYDAPAAKSYFVGCSSGGRQGLISAQRFPDDFDGIVVGAPALDFTGTMAHYTVMHRALAAAPISAEHVRVLAEKVYEKCDALDGLADGLIDDPRRCSFDPGTDIARCASSGDTAACLTEAQAASLRAVYGDVITSKGTKIASGFPVGGEALVPSALGRSGWLPWIISEDGPPISLRFAESFFREMATPGSPIDWRQFDPERDMDKLTTIATLLNATNPDLERFRARGGKILMYFGWADPALNPMMGLNYYERVRETMGAATGDFFRLFMMPGVLHCTGGNGPSAFDSITPLVNWVERGTAPDRLIASLRQGGKIIRTRPLCPYPMVAKYGNAGSKDDAASFTCSMPQQPSAQR
ncbi:MAG TPA: tannase/feruloyl esterase family alpha/beta hydrolase [Vicinamibacterales bacterium]|jgi:feruloyl esterase|nr:tannase/feruloyl esterase family alpha/beta hydrolase [Vicinamibacterales bacterium]